MPSASTRVRASPTWTRSCRFLPPHFLLGTATGTRYCTPRWVLFLIRKSRISRPLPITIVISSTLSMHSNAPATPRAHFPRHGLGTGAPPRQFIPYPLTAYLPGLYGKGERFSHFYDASGKTGSIMSGVVWEHLLTVQKDPDAIAPLTRAGATMIVPNAEPLCRRANSTCPITGTWQPWVRNDHPMRAVVNQYWRQTWLTAGQRFPHPQRDWLLTLPESDITWHLMDASKVNINL